MSMTTYLPADYLEAGFRAESAGDRERAAQYYAYLAEAFPESPEGEAARGGLIRMGMTGRIEPGGARNNGPGSAEVATTSPTGGRAARQGEPRTAPKNINGGWAHGGPVVAPDGFSNPASDRGSADHAGLKASPSTQPGDRERIRLADLQRQAPAGAAMPVPTSAQAVRAPAPSHGQMSGQTEEHMRLPEVLARRAREMSEPMEDADIEPRYRVARVGARVLLWCGWLFFCAGLALGVLVGLGTGAGVLKSMSGLPVGLGAASGMLIGGLTLIVIATAALAAFDSANDVRALKAWVMGSRRV